MNLEEDELNKIFEEKLFLKVKHKQECDNKENRLGNDEFIFENKNKLSTFNPLKEIPVNVLAGDKSIKSGKKTKKIYVQKDKEKEITMNEINGKIDDVYRTKEKIEKGKFIPSDDYLNEKIDDVYRTKEKIESGKFIGDTYINEKYVNTILNINESTNNNHNLDLSNENYYKDINENIVDSKNITNDTIENHYKDLNENIMDLKNTTNDSIVNSISSSKLNKELNQNDKCFNTSIENENINGIHNINNQNAEIINIKKVGENIINQNEFCNLNNVVKGEKIKTVTFKDDVKINLLKNNTNMININQEILNENEKSEARNKMKIIEQEFIKFKTAHFESLKMKSKIYKFINLEIFNLEMKYRNKISNLEKENLDLKKKVYYLEDKYEKYKMFVKKNLEILKNKIMVEMKQYKKKYNSNLS